MSPHWNEVSRVACCLKIAREVNAGSACRARGVWRVCQRELETVRNIEVLTSGVASCTTLAATCCQRPAAAIDKDDAADRRTVYTKSMPMTIAVQI